MARHIHALSVEQAQAGHEVTILALDPEKSSSAYRTVPFTLSAARKEIASSDLVHLHGARVPLSAVCSLISLFSKVKVIYTPHCYYDRSSFANKAVKFLWDQIVERFIIRTSQAVILLNDDWVRYLKSKRLYIGNSVVIPNCISSERIFSLSKQLAPTELRTRGDLNIFYIGRLDPVKRIEDILYALTSDHLKLSVAHIVGGGVDRQRLEHIAMELGVQDRVLFYGRLDDEQAFAIAKACDVFVLPSAEEGLPTVLLEMILLGVPVVCTQIPGNLAITESVGIESTYEVGDVEGLVKLLTSSRQGLSEATTEKVVEIFTWERRAKDILSLYCESLKGPTYAG